MGLSSTLRVWEETREVNIAWEVESQNLNEDPSSWKGIRLYLVLRKVWCIPFSSGAKTSWSTNHQCRPKRCDYLYQMAPGLKSCQELYRSWTWAGTGIWNVRRQCFVFLGPRDELSLAKKKWLKTEKHTHNLLTDWHHLCAYVSVYLLNSSHSWRTDATHAHSPWQDPGRMQVGWGLGRNIGFKRGSSNSLSAYRYHSGLWK